MHGVPLEVSGQDTMQRSFRIVTRFVQRQVVHPRFKVVMIAVHFFLEYAVRRLDEDMAFGLVRVDFKPRITTIEYSRYHSFRFSYSGTAATPFFSQRIASKGMKTTNIQRTNGFGW